MTHPQTLLAFLLVAVVASTVQSALFGPICDDNPSSTLRGCDDHGCGHYGASRGSRTHKGIDIKCTAGKEVLAPFPGTIVRRSRPYGNGGTYDNGLLFQGTGDYSEYKAKIWYFTPDSTSGTKSKGDRLGISVTLNGKYNDITDHLHIQVYKNGVIINPTNLF